MRRPLLSVVVFGLLCSMAQAQVIVPNTSTWKWLHPTDGKDPAKDDPDFHSTFYKADFDDSKWKEGQDKPGPRGGFGYGEENFDYVDIGQPAPEHRKTAYFRLKFKTEKAFDSLTFKCQRDDGVIVYLDGKEVARDNVPHGDEAYDLLATSTIGSTAIPDETAVIAIPIRQKLEPGEHVLAISLHNRGQAGVEYSSDLRIAEISLSAGDAGLAQQKTTTKAPPAPPAAREQPPDAKAYFDAMRLTDPAKKIEALQKHLVDFPNVAGTVTVKRQLLGTLIKTYPDQKEKLLGEIDKLIAATPDTSKGDLYTSVANDLLDAGVLLDEAGGFATKALALMDEQKFFQDQKRIAESRKLSPPSDDELKKRFRVARTGPQSALGRVYLKLSKLAEAEKLLKEVLEANPTSPLAASALADLAQKRGDDALALDYLAASVLAGRSPEGTQARLEALYTKLHKDAKPGDLDRLLDDRYRKQYPTLHVAPYQSATARSDRTVVAEIFTGAGCPPCVAADTAFDAMLERYSRKDLVVLMYHQHIPLPDPMANPSTLARWKYYPGVRGVPSYFVDGEVMPGVYGGRDVTQTFYDRINPSIEQRLEAGAEARLTLHASLEAAQVKVKADVSQIKAGASVVKLQVALVEELLSYSGENGIRLHPMVVRSLAGEGALGISVDPAKPAAVEHTFDLAKLTEELKTHLDEYEAKSTTGRKFSQKKHEIKPDNLSVVAFVQDQTSQKILQAAYVRLKSGNVATNQ